MTARRRSPRRTTADVDGDDAPDDPGADDLILGHADDDRPLDRDWDSEARETDSFADLSGPGGEAAKRSTSTGSNIRPARSPNICSTSCTAPPAPSAGWPG